MENTATERPTVVEGQAEILGHVLGAGSYVHIPGGVSHDIDATNTGGCTVFYLYIRPAGWQRS